MPTPVTLALLGAGNRGAAYARRAASGGRARVTALADPRAAARRRVMDEHGLSPDHAVADWRELASRPRLADAVVVATQDAQHVEPAVRFAELGYHILLEKPMATSQEDCARIVTAAESAGVMLAVCHVLRYTPYTRALKALVEGGRIGEIMSVEHVEPVGWWHYAHSFVRGNWRREEESTFMLLAKSCHDIDWLSHVLGRQAQRVSSFGGLHHFRPENRPPGATARCLDCPVESTCPYSAPRLYLSCLGDADREYWPLSVITDDLTEQGVLQALRDGPYGRCVYDCDNTVVDNQVVQLEYEGGVTASFTMTAFSAAEHRKSRLFGTHGSIEGDGINLWVHDFRDDTRETIDTASGADASAAGGHGGGDQGVVDAFLNALETGDRSAILSGPRESLASHQVVWAAERARRTGTVVDIPSAANIAVPRRFW